MAGEVAIFEEDYNPNLTNAEIYSKTVSLGLPVEVFENSYVKLQRHWIDKNYPDYELSELLSECWLAVSALLFDAPNSGLSASGKEGARLPPCMHEQLHMRATLMKVSGETLVPMVISSESVSVDDEKRAVVQENYRDTPLFRSAGERDKLSERPFRGQCELLFEQAKAVLQQDRYHVHLAIVFVGKSLAQLIEIRNEDKASKYATIRDLASTMERIGADAVIMVSEAWSAPFDPSNPYRGAADSPTRQEGLMLVGATMQGEAYCFTAPFFRTDGGISFGDESVVDAKNTNVIQPIIAMWEKQKGAGSGGEG